MIDYLDAKLRVNGLGEGRTIPIWPRGRGVARYKPHFRVGADGEYLGVAFVDGPEELAPGGEAEVTVALIYSETGVDYSPLQPGVAFEVLEGAQVVAAGRVLRRYQRDRDWRPGSPTA